MRDYLTMRVRAITMLLVLAISGLASAAEAPLRADYTLPYKNVESIYAVDADGYGDPEIYAVSFGKGRVTAYALTIEGGVIQDSVVSREGGQEAGREETQIVAVADIDGNGRIDYLTGTEIQSPGVRNHRLYRLQMTPEEGLGRVYNRFVWMVKDTGRVSAIHVDDVNGDGVQEAVASSYDNAIRAYDLKGGLVAEAPADSPVFDFEIIPLRNSSGSVVGRRYLAAEQTGLYVMGTDGTVIWRRTADARFDETGAYDLDGDGEAEAYGISGATLYAYGPDGTPLWERAFNEPRAMERMAFPGDNQSYLVVSDSDRLVFLTHEGIVVAEGSAESKVRSLLRVDLKRGVKLIAGMVEGITSYTVNADLFSGSKAVVEYGRAEKALDAGNFSLALDSAQAAEELWLRAGDYDGEAKANSLKERAQGLLEADRQYLLAEQSYKAGNYEESVKYAGRAGELYAEHGYHRGVNLSEALGQRKPAAVSVMDAARERMNADEHYAAAEESYIRGDYGESLRLSDIAAGEYRRLGDEANAQVAERLYGLSLRGIAESSSSTTMVATTLASQAAGTQGGDLAYYGLGIAVAVIALAVFLKLRNG